MDLFTGARGLGAFARSFGLGLAREKQCAMLEGRCFGLGEVAGARAANRFRGG
jgi:hypothetical protein